jgi:NADH-quinone oxidoreductase subunit N
MANVTFPFPFPEHLVTLVPEMCMAVAAMAILIGDLFLPAKRKHWSGYVTIAVCVLTAFLVVKVMAGRPLVAFYGFFVLDPFAAFAKVLILTTTAVATILSIDYMRGEAHTGEYYVLMLFAALGMMLMASSNTFIMLYLGLELMALCVYVLVGYQREVLRSGEAALKYFVLGSLASCLLLYGISFLYGVTGSFDFAAVGQGLAGSNGNMHTAVLLGMVFMLSGLLFKLSVAPFHMWTPDAYEGAPTPITAFMSVAPKVAMFVLLIRVLVNVLPSLQHDYVLVLSALAVLTMAVGNVAAIAQRNIKRMLAYSTIGHVGFVMLGLIAGGAAGYAAVLTYLSVYMFMSLGAFAIISLMRREGIQGELLDDFAGLAKARPGYGLAMSLMLFSLAGIPFLGGFWAKYAVFLAAIEAGHLYLVIIGVLFSVVGAYYYIRVVKYIYFDEERVAFNFSENKLMQATVAVTAIAVVAIGIFPGPLMALCKSVVTSLV